MLDGRLLAVASSRGLRFYDLDRKSDVAFLPVREGTMELSILGTVHPDGYVLCGGAAGCRRWFLQQKDDGTFALKAGELVAAVNKDCVTGVDVANGLAAIASEEVLTLWRAPSSAKNPLVRTAGHSGLWDAVPSPDGRFVACGYFANHHPERENARVIDANSVPTLSEVHTRPAIRVASASSVPGFFISIA